MKLSKDIVERAKNLGLRLEFVEGPIDTGHEIQVGNFRLRGSVYALELELERILKQEENKKI